MFQNMRERESGDMSVKLARINYAYCYVVVTLAIFHIPESRTKRQYRLFVDYVIKLG